MATVKEISVFVDESGSFSPLEADPTSPYYLLCMVFHDQNNDISADLKKLSESLQQIGLDGDHSIHAGPLIRRENEYANMPREMRIGIFRRMMAFIQKANFKYHCFKMYKRYNSKKDAIHDEILQALVDFLIANRDEFNSCDAIKVYYDNGQLQVTSLLKEAFAIFSSKVQFVPEVFPGKYRLFQVADAACTLELVAAKLNDTGVITGSEDRFFGGVKNLKKNYLKPLFRKQWA